MEAGSFATDVAESTADPFGGNEGEGEFAQGADPFSQPDIPVVDKEGNEVGAAAEEAPAEGVIDARASAAVAAQTADPPGEMAQASEDAAAAAAAAAQAAAQPKVGSDGGPLTTGASPTKAKKPRAPRQGTGERGYHLLTPDGTDKFTRLQWLEDKDGNVVKTGGKPTNVANVGNKKEALAIGYAALGEPDKPVKLIATPVSFFDEKTVGPDEQPQRRRPLKIT